MQCISLTRETLRLHGHRALQLLDEYWHGLALRGGVPHWSAVDPKAFQDALEYAFMADCVGKPHARLRVAGGAVSSVVGGDLRGLPLSVFFGPRVRPRFQAALAQVIKGGCPADLTLSAPQAGATGRMVLYPLVDDQGQVTQVLGGLIVGGDAGPAPRRYNIDHIRHGATPQRPRPAPALRGPALRLVVDNG